MIPKIVHSCWFGGGEKPPLIRRCEESWRTVLRGYDFIEWREDNTPIDHPYFTELKRLGIWSYVSDIVRWWALREFGGVYLDTDCECIRPLERYHEKDLVYPLMRDGHVNGYFVMAEKSHPFVDEMLRFGLRTRAMHLAHGAMQLRYLSLRHIEEHGKPPAHFVHCNVAPHLVFARDYRADPRFRGELSEVTRVIHYGTTTWGEQAKRLEGRGKEAGGWRIAKKKIRRLRYSAARRFLERRYPGLTKPRPISPEYLPPEEQKGGWRWD